VSEIEFNWQPRIEGDIAHVEEFLDGVHQITYGPMPSQIVEAFILERKQSVMRTFMRIYGDETNGQNPPPQDQS
jgi:hypothetical protein